MYFDENENQAIVIDNGSSLIKAGFAGDDVPHTVFPTVVGENRFQFIRGVNSNYKDKFIGHAAIKNRGILNRLSYPITDMGINNWDHLEEIWHYTFDVELHVEPENHPVLLTEPVSYLCRSANRQKMTEIMFETFNVPELYIANQNALSLCSSGRTSGAVVNIGHGSPRIALIYEGYERFSNILHGEGISGSDLTEDFARSTMLSNGMDFSYVRKFELFRQMKEKFCYVALDFEEEMMTAKSSPSKFDDDYELPDGTIMKVRDERFHSPEALFRPALMGSDGRGIHEVLYNAIMKCNIDYHNDLYRNIVLSGGTTMLPGFVDRLQKEMALLAPSTYKIRVIASPERKYSAWIGGSLLASMPTFRSEFLSKQDYSESGPSIVHRKRFTFLLN